MDWLKIKILAPFSEISEEELLRQNVTFTTFMLMNLLFVLSIFLYDFGFYQNADNHSPYYFSVLLISAIVGIFNYLLCRFGKHLAAAIAFSIYSNSAILFYALTDVIDPLDSMATLFLTIPIAIAAFIIKFRYAFFIYLICMSSNFVVLYFSHKAEFLSSTPMLYNLYICQLLLLGAFLQDRNIKNIVQDREKLIQSEKFVALGEMAAGIAHEISNPLTIISTTTELMRRKSSKNQTDESIQDDFKKLNKTMKRINTIIKGMRNVSRSSSSEDLITQKDVYLLIDEVTSLCKQKIKAHGITLQYAKSSPVAIVCKQIQFEQVLLNLMGNAIDAVKELDKKWIKIEVEKKGKNLLVKVIDSGGGISSTLQKKIFIPYFTTKGVGKGTGLGLSLSKSFMREQKGDLFLDCNLKNTCFVMEIPTSIEGNHPS